MGMLKDLRATRATVKEMSKDWDPAAQLREGMARMQQMTATLQVQADPAGTMPAQATVVRTRHTGATINDQPVLTIELLVTLPGQPPVPSVASGPVPLTQLAMLRPGDTIDVLVDPAQPTRAVLVRA